jgi:hypothetical protein
MASQAELQALLNMIIPNGQFTAAKMNPLLQGILNQAFYGNAVEEISMVNAATTQLSNQCGSAVLSNSVSTYTVKLPAAAQLGQKVVIFIGPTGTVGTLSVKDSDGNAVGTMSAAAFDTITYSLTDTAWLMTGFAGTIV